MYYGGSSSYYGEQPDNDAAAGDKDSLDPRASPDWDRLRELAAPAALRQHQSRTIMRQVILPVCRQLPLRLADLAELIRRKSESLPQQDLIPPLEEGQIRYLYPGEPIHPQQAYVASALDGRDG